MKINTLLVCSVDPRQRTLYLFPAVDTAHAGVQAVIDKLCPEDERRKYGDKVCFVFSPRDTVLTRPSDTVVECGSFFEAVRRTSFVMVGSKKEA